MNTKHLIFECEGSRFDLVLTSDPYGGTLVVWPVCGLVWRYFEGDRLQPLSKNCSKYDGDLIYRHLEGEKE